MNDQKIELPPLPEWVGWPVTVSEMSASDVKEAMQDYARAAIEADRKRRGEPVGWLYEDELPDNYPYDTMFPYSKVDGVRMFPVYAPQPAEPVKRKRRYAQGTALGEFGIIPMCDQVDDEPVKVPSDLPVTEQEDEEWRRLEASRD